MCIHGPPQKATDHVPYFYLRVNNTGKLKWVLALLVYQICVIRFYQVAREWQL
jgi:hypothetical protein